LSKNVFNKLYRNFFKRFFDIIFSFLALIVLSPLLFIIALLVRIKLGSPVIFKQERPGLNEKIFVDNKLFTSYNSLFYKEIKVA